MYERFFFTETTSIMFYYSINSIILQAYDKNKNRQVGDFCFM